jgi:tetratricopeptide (TPR) repeat protein
MMKKIICLLILFLFFTSTFFGEEIVVTYLEGVLEMRVGTTWEIISEEDSVKPDAVLRLSDHAIAELTLNDICITIVQQGIYNLGDMIEESKKTESYGLDAIFTSKVLAIFSDTDEKNLKESQAGVRAEKVEDEIGWIDDTDTLLLLESGRKKINKGDYQEAVKDFKDALENALCVKESMLLFYIGYCYDRMGKEAIALSYLTDMDISADEPFYPDYVLLFGKLLVKSFAYEEALELFTDFFKQTVVTEEQTLQGISFLTSICYMQLGNHHEAKTYFLKTKEINPSSDVGKQALELLRTL